MSQCQLFDSVKTKEEIALEGGGVTPEGCLGAIVEVFNDGEAYLLELFGDWVVLSDDGDFAPSTREANGSFMSTLGVETVYSHQLRLIILASETVGACAQLLALMDELPEQTLETVRNFAEFFKERCTSLVETS